jgi:flotillin
MFTGPVVAVVSLVIALILFGALWAVAKRYKKVPPNIVMVVYGRKRRTPEGKIVGYRIVTGGATFIMPLLEEYRMISLNLIQIQLKIENTPNLDGVLITVEAVGNVKISSEPELLAAAIERFLGYGIEEITTQIHDILEGQLRQIIGTLRVEEIVQRREKITEQVTQNAAVDLSRIGIRCDLVVVNRISDNLGYIEALGKKRTAEVIRDASIGQAEAQRDSTIKSSNARREGEQTRLDNDAQIAAAQRDLDMKKAQYNALVAEQQAIAAQAGPKANAMAMQDVKKQEVKVQEVETEARIAVSMKESERRQKELVATQIRPAEAQKESIVITAEGEATAAVTKAEGDAKAVRIRAEGDKAAQIARAEGEKVRLAAQGEGEAAADRAKRTAAGEGEALAIKARGDAEGSAIRAKGLAEGEAIQAKLVAEATGILKKAEAYKALDRAAMIQMILEKAPLIIQEIGLALNNAAMPFAELGKGIGTGLGNIDKVQIVDMGGGTREGGSAVTRFAMTVPDVLFGVLAKLKTLGIDIDAILKKIGIDPSQLNELIAAAPAVGTRGVEAPTPAAAADAKPADVEEPAPPKKK